MDEELRRALQVVNRHGKIGLDVLLEMFPILRHERRVVERFRVNLPRFKVELDEEWEKWRCSIPSLQFPADWKIQIIPPMVGAIIRFHVNDIVSVYLDCYNKLGIFTDKDDKPLPYWEIHPYQGDCARYAMEDVEGLLKGITEILTGEYEDD